MNWIFRFSVASLYLLFFSVGDLDPFLVALESEKSKSELTSGSDISDRNTREYRCWLCRAQGPFVRTRPDYKGQSCLFALKQNGATTNKDLST